MASSRVIRVRTSNEEVMATLRAGIEKIQDQLGVSPEFPPEVEEAARKAAANPRLPELDRTDLPFVTIDPEGAQDLDQAVHVERDGDGYLVHYAIADVAAFVTAGDPIDVEAHKRGQTLYGPESKVPLHPTVISEDAASLLPDQMRPSLLWSIKVDETGEGTEVVVERARVRSTAQLTYEAAQQMIDDGSAPETLMLVKEIGLLRQAREAARGGISLPLPEQQVDTDDGRWRLEFRSLLPIEEWNAQISLLTGMGAASLMVYGRVGLLRTLPEPDPRDIKRLHRTARGLGVEWPSEELVSDFLRDLDPNRPDHAAVVLASTRLLRGSGYVAFDGEVPAEPMQAALASEYAHVTAPLRRLADRYAGEVCVALCAGEPVPDWVHAALPELPREMQSTGHQASNYEHMSLDLVEAGLLAHRVGEEFEAAVVSASEKDAKRGTVILRELGVEAPVSTDDGELPVGERVQVRLTSADVEKRNVRFELIP